MLFVTTIAFNKRPPPSPRKINDSNKRPGGTLSLALVSDVCHPNSVYMNNDYEYDIASMLIRGERSNIVEHKKCKHSTSSLPIAAVLLHIMINII